MNETNIMTNTRIPVDCECEDGKQVYRGLYTDDIHIESSGIDSEYCAH